MNSQVNLLRIVIAGAETLVETQGWTPGQVAKAVTLWFKRQDCQWCQIAHCGPKCGCKCHWATE